MICQNKFEHYANWMEVPSPSFHLKKGSDELLSNWTLVGQKIVSILARKFEKDFGISEDKAVSDYIMETR